MVVVVICGPAAMIGCDHGGGGGGLLRWMDGSVVVLVEGDRGSQI